MARVVWSHCGVAVTGAFLDYLIFELATTDGTEDCEPENNEAVAYWRSWPECFE